MARTPEEHDRLDRAFAALADPVRRAIIARLSTGPATVNELAEPFPITVQAVSQHVQVLEQAGLVTRTRQAQRRPVHLDPAALEAVTAWIDTYRLQAERSYRRVDAGPGEIKEEQGAQTRRASPRRTAPRSSRWSANSTPPSAWSSGPRPTPTWSRSGWAPASRRCES